MTLGKELISDYSSVVSINLFVALLTTCIVVCYLFEENRWMSESIIALAIGLCTGAVILHTSRGKSSRLLLFSENLFFVYLLPPIIFNAGFQMKKKHFFCNIMTIMLFGAFGTLISFGIISLGATYFFPKMDIDSLEIGDYLAIGAIFAATDSVSTLQVLNQDETPLLYSLVFGEGVINDATSVVLFNAIQNFDLSRMKSSIALHFVGSFLYLFVASTVLGILVGLLSGYIIRKLHSDRASDREIALMMLMAYLSYMLAELFDLSAILTVFFCGIVMSHYTWNSMTENSSLTTKHAFATLSFLAETFIFLYVGMDALDIEKWRIVRRSPWKSVGVSSILVGLILIGRAAFVFPLSFLSNLTKKSKYDKVNLKQQVIILWAGLTRGAVSMALAYNQFTRSGHTQLSGNAIMITSTITVVLFSTVVFGLIKKPLVRLLVPPSNYTSSILSSESSSPKYFTVQFLSNGHSSETDHGCQIMACPTNLQLLLSTPIHSVHYYWRKFYNAFMRPVFGGRGFVSSLSSSVAEEGIPEWQ